MNTANTVVSVIVFAIAGGFVGMVTARATATLIARSWLYKACKEEEEEEEDNKIDREVFVDVVTTVCTIFGAIGGSFAGFFGAAFGLLYLFAEAFLVPTIIAAVWGIVVAARWAIKAGLKLSNCAVECLESLSED